MTVLEFDTAKEVPEVKSEESVVVVWLQLELFVNVPEKETSRGEPVPT
jgi:hypothetical protein